MMLAEIEQQQPQVTEASSGIEAAGLMSSRQNVKLVQHRLIPDSDVWPVRR